MKKDIQELIKRAKSDCWEYHKDLLKEQGFKKSDIGDLDCNFEDWEDIAYFEGYIHALEEFSKNS